MHIQVCSYVSYDASLVLIKVYFLIFIPLMCGIAYLSVLTSKYRLSRKRNLPEKVSSVEPVAKYVALRWICFFALFVIDF